MVSKILLMWLMTLAYASCSQIKDPQSNSPTVCANHVGCVVGKLMPGYQIDNFEAFVGIPYAQPPVGELRFSSPQPFPKSDKTINATEPKPECIQKNSFISKVTGAEDCLFLNIYRPVSRECSSKLLPVMVYIHEGGFAIGTANADKIGPQHFMDTQEVILVTIAYRLGVMGFLSTNDSAIPGNFGMKDQRLGLKWIQQNIGDFGGDPEQVTIFGLSAGGISTHLHMLSKNSEGLFQRAISLSGVASNPITFQRNPLELARQTAANCNISNASILATPQLLQELRSVPVETLMAADGNIRYWDLDLAPLCTLVVENSDTSDTFLNRTAKEIIESGDYKAVPFLTGVVPQEGAVRSAAIWENITLRNSLNENFDHHLEALLLLPTHFNRSRLDYIMERIIDEYFDGNHVLTKQGLLDVLTDIWFHYPFYRVSKAFIHNIDTNQIPLYLYRFNFSGPHSIASIYAGGLSNAKYGVVHGDDLLYLFKTSFPEFPKMSTDAKAIQGYVNFFVEFATNRKSFVGKECNLYTFPADSNDSICEFVTFENGPNDEFVIGTDNKFQVRRARLLENLLDG